jgi:hypothetical protein
MQLPFTPDQFFGVFAAYNRSFWIVAIALWIAGVAAVGAAWRDPSRRSRALAFTLALLWGWNAVAYHALFFTRINPAAWLFAALFAVQGALFLRAGTRRRVEFFSAPAWVNGLGAGLAIYAFAYPLLNITFGHAYPGTPTFGVPCPRDILTIGVLLTARGAVSPALAVIPVLWGFVGGSAALLLEVWPDYVLLAAGAFLAIAVVARGLKRFARSR